MRQFTIKDIRDFEPCYDPNKYLPENWSGTILDILNNKAIPFEDRLWVICRNEFVSDKLMRLFAVWSARQVQHLMQDQRSINALDVAERFANGLATQQEMADAWDAAWDAAWAVARAAGRAAARAAAVDAQEVKLREMILAGIETGDVK